MWEHSEKAATPSNVGVLRLLVVDDFKEMRESICDFLSGIGHEVFSAASGEEALHLLKQNGSVVDVLITDIEMPKMDGVELWGRIHEILPEAKVLFLSGHSSDLVLKHASLPGEVLGKPFDLPVLQQKLQKLVEKRSML